MLQFVCYVANAFLCENIFENNIIHSKLKKEIKLSASILLIQSLMTKIRAKFFYLVKILHSKI